MEEKKYLTVAEVANMTNRSTQSIYKRMSTTLQPYVVKVGNKKMLDSSVLEILENNSVGNSSTNVGNTRNNVDNAEKPIIDILNKQLEVMNKQIETLIKQVEVKDKQIESLDKRLEQALKNSSESHFVLAQQQHKALAESNEKLPWYKRIFKNNKGVEEDNGEVQER